MIKMKTVKKIIGLAILVLFFAPLTQVMAQGPPAPPPGEAGNGDQPIGGNAPIGTGLVILSTLGLAYGGKKVFDARQKLEE
jgi:hypothetical protein